MGENGVVGVALLTDLITCEIGGYGVIMVLFAEPRKQGQKRIEKILAAVNCWTGLGC
jgi:hypothetical protein